MLTYIEVALPVASFKLFTYKLDIDEKNTLPGRRVLVPFGKRILTGIIIRESEQRDNIKDIIELLDDKPIFNDNLLKLCAWIADYYICGMGEVLNVALPPGFTPQSSVKVTLLKEIDKTSLEMMSKSAPKRAALIAYLSNRVGPFNVGYLEKELRTDNISAQLNALEKLGFVYIEREIGTPTKAKIVQSIKISTEYWLDENKLTNIIDQLDKSAPKQALAISLIYLKQKKAEISVPISDFVKESKISRETINALVKKGILSLENIEIDRSKIKAYNKFSTIDESKYQLNDEQNKCFDNIMHQISDEVKKPILINGVTGSGKTLVYMKLITEVIAKGKQALMLVPEISLTPQLISRFNNAFPGKITLLHSRMSDGERYDAWRNIANGKSEIIIGTRSAIFAPLCNPGIIIVDEEHDLSYKQDGFKPYYNARDCAVIRSRIENIPLVLGSATPSIESSYNASKGKYSLLEITKRADDAKLPEISLVNPADARKIGQLKGNFTQSLIDEMLKRIQNHEGTILLQNRRGFAIYIECKDCGNIPHCRYCSVTLTYHKKSELLRCHYCGYTERVPKICHVCGGNDLSEIGSGTQRVEDEISQVLQDYNTQPRIARLDLDTTSKKGAMEDILLDFAQGKYDIMLGTQMVAKGLDFERVSLVGVINADLQFAIPDFRSAERTFQLLTQVSGRAGRNRDLPGKVIIQTKNPLHFAIVSAQNNNYSSFYQTEISNRKRMNYPPFSRFIKIELSSKNENLVDSAAKQLFNLIKPKEYFEKLGPTIPSVYKIKSKYKRIIVIKVIKSKDPLGTNFRNDYLSALNNFKALKFSTVDVLIDVDSYSGV